MKQLIVPIFLIQSLSLLAPTQFCRKPSTFFNEPSAFELAMNTTDSFGKTHFIVGRPTRELSQASNDVQQGTDYVPQATYTPFHTQVIFTPDDNIRDELLRYIRQETERIQIAIFVITDQEIAKALLNALNRNVAIELITDVGCLKERANKINTLCEHGCTVRIYNPSYDTKNKAGIMHHKFVLFTNNLGKSLVWTGSYNFTKAASNTNQENAIILDDQKTFDIFSKQFKRLKKRSYRYGQGRKSARS